MKTNKLNNKVKLVLLSIVSILVLSACEKDVPEGVSQEFWNDMIERISYIEEMHEKNEFVDSNISLMDVEDQNKLSDTEMEIYYQVASLSMDSISSKIEKNNKLYNERYEIIKQIFKNEIK